MPPTTPESLSEATPAGAGDWIVEKGETLDAIAFRSGHFRETLRTLAENEALMGVRAGGATLLPGDRLTVPEIRPVARSCATGRRHVFRRRGVPAEIRFVVRKPDGKPFTDKPYRITVGPRAYEGLTDGEGKIQAWVEPLARQGRLVIELREEGYPKTLERVIDIGTMWPLDTVRGVQQRLNALRFDCGEVTGAMSPATAKALQAFQVAKKIEPTGLIDQATVDALKAEHGF